jgi:Domain of unknown function (DUF6933)
VILRCTKKLLAVIGAGLVTDPGLMPDAEDWYANLLWLDRRKCLLLTHSATLFTIFEPDVTAASLRATDHLITRLIERELARESLPATTFHGPEPTRVTLATSADRSLLGCMNDMALHCKYAVADYGSLQYTDIGALNQSLRRNINSARGYRPPIELATGRGWRTPGLLGACHRTRAR